MRSFAFIALALAVSPALADSYVLQNVRIVSPGKPVVERGMIIVSDDKIVHVGAPTAFESGYTVLDCTGLTAYPGFIDAYTNDGLDLPDAAENGEAPSAVDGPLAGMWHENRKGIYADLDVSLHVNPKELTAFHAQGVTTAMLASGRGAFGGLTAVVNALDGEKASVLHSRVFQEMTFNTVGGGYPGSAMARIALLRQLLFDGEYYVAHPPQDGEADAIVSAIGDVATGLQRTLFEADSEREIHRALNLVDEFDLRVAILGTQGVWRHAEELKQRAIPVIAEVALPREPRKELSDDPVRKLNDPPIEYLMVQHAEWQEECKAILKMHEAGVRFALSSGGDTDEFLANVRKHIGLGLPAEVALQALTLNAAELLGVADKIGSIEVGKLANLLLMTGDFDKADTKVKHVFVAGKKHDIAEGN